ncbi:MAG TPA: CTP synthase, partial [Patescibacteria group bacterium]
MKYIFVVGGVVSGLGKGIVSSSLGMLLKSCGFKVNHIKIDPYLNVDAGTMRPAEHGETFVTADGGEIDQDLGNYERFLNQNFSKENNITSGKVYQTIIANERAFKYEGRDVEMIPDVPNEVKRRFYEMEKGYDFVVVEIGGTTGDIENLPFLYAAREVGREREAMYAMVSFVPFLSNVGELKTKPTQHAVSELRSTGINPDILITRDAIPLDAPRRETLARRCFMDNDAIFDDPDAESIYDVPLILEKQGILKKIFKVFKIKERKPELKEWENFVRKCKEPKKEVRIALVGKYVTHGANKHNDVYVSVLEALKHAAAENEVKVTIEAIDANDIDTKELTEGNFDGVVVPQGWGGRGVEGKIAAAKWARENKVPYLGLCFGMQMAVIEASRNLLGIKGANSEEADSAAKDKVIHVMPDQKEYLLKHQYGGTIRLGEWPCKIKKGTRLFEIYQEELVSERHRH